MPRRSIHTMSEPTSSSGQPKPAGLAQKLLAAGVSSHQWPQSSKVSHSSKEDELTSRLYGCV